MATWQSWVRGHLGNFLFGLWLVLLGLCHWAGMIQLGWVNVGLGILLIAAGVFHLVEI